MKQIISFNNKYVLKPDSGRTLILSSMVGRNLNPSMEDSFTNVIHPIYAMILSFIDGRDLKACVNDAAEYLAVSPELVSTFIKKLIDNPNRVVFRCKEGVSAFPPFTIISTQQEISIKYFPDMFSYESIDLSMKRHLTPSTITLMVNNTCFTDCIYCYQDKRKIHKCSIPLKRIIEIIHEARLLHVNSFDVIGGEFFLYPNWKEVLAELRKYNFNPYISTKIPLKENDISFLAEIGLCDIQLSIDSFLEEHLTTSLRVKSGYVDSLKETLNLLEKYGISVMVHTVLTKYNDSIEDMKSIYDVISKKSNILHWHIVKGDSTLYPKVEYSQIEISDEAINNMSRYMSDLSEKSKFQIIYPQPTIETENQNNFEDLKQTFFNRSFCSGLYSSLYILPDGQVTMCEQLYWNPIFIVGNILENSIKEIWNSQKALSLYNIKQSDIPKESLCSSCKDFRSCREFKQVCYREIIKKYGPDKWFYPDAGCPYAKD